MMLPNAKETYAAITDFLTDAFSPQQLLDFIGSQRSKTMGIQVVRLDLPPATTGCAIGLRDADVIGIRRDVTPDVYWFVFGHEASHYLLKHVPALSAGEETANFAEFMISKDVQTAILRVRALGTDDPQERERELEAEQLGRRIKKCFDRFSEHVPEAITVYHSLRPTR